MDQGSLLKVRGITKTFGTVTALRAVDFDLCRGEIHGLIGENGSGKSTLTSIIAGMQKADCGEILFEGKPWKPTSMLTALNQGIGIIVQESGVIPDISVAENIFLGEVGGFRSGPFISRSKMTKAANSALEDIGVNNIQAAMPTNVLDFQERKLIEIAGVHMKKPTVWIIDETTTALSQRGRTLLYELIKTAKAENKAVIFISHDLDEIMEVCDSLTVLRDGEMIRTFSKDEFDADAIRGSMIGRELEGDYYRNDWGSAQSDEIVLEARDLCLAGELENFSMQLRKGEILGLGGLSHCGMHSLGKCLFGAVKPEGSVLVNGKRITNEKTAVAEKIGYVSKDRDTESLSLNASVMDNIAAAGLDTFSRKNFFVLYGDEKRYADSQIASLSIKCAARSQAVSQLSGGNKQKVVFGKWIACNSKILILDSPTRGVDIGVKQAMYKLMMKLKSDGCSIVMISEELQELIGMSDRIIIMKDGRADGEFIRHPELSESELIKHMI